MADYNRVYSFANGYGASVVSNQMSYGGRRGLYEVAVLDADGNFCYTTPVTSDVVGYLTFDEVKDILKQIEDLPPPPLSKERRYKEILDIIAENQQLVQEHDWQKGPAGQLARIINFIKEEIDKLNQFKDKVK